MSLLILSGAFAAVEWYAEVQQNRRLIYLSKPSMMLCLIAWVWLTAGTDSTGIVWFLIGQGLCLLGDIFLMLPPERFFLPGLVAFLLGHVFYIAAFGRLWPVDGAGLGWVIWIVLALSLVSLSVYRRLARGMDASGTQRMKGPVAGYTLVIALMTYSALLKLFDPAWNYTAALWVSSGALLFLVSDILNAWARFIGGIANHRFKIMTTYHLAQIALAVGWVLASA